jgi:hypothetical protein
MSELATEPVSTSSIGFDVDARTELDFARSVAEMHQTDHHDTSSGRRTSCVQRFKINRHAIRSTTVSSLVSSDDALAQGVSNVRRFM